MNMNPTLLVLVLVLGAFVLPGCDDGGAPNAQRALLASRVPRVKAILRRDREQHREGLFKAATPLARGFGVEDPASRTAQFRTALRRLQEPPRGVAEFISSPMSFLAVVGHDGVVVARDTTEADDRMTGQDFGAQFPVVRETLREGTRGYGLGEFPPMPEEGESDEAGESSFSMLFTAPLRRDGEIIGAVVAGIPLWREAQRLSRQLRVELAPELESNGLIVWVYMYRGARIFHFDSPPELDAVVPNAEVRRQGLARSPGGFTGSLALHGKNYGYAVVPTPAIGERVGVIVFQSEDGSCADSGDCSGGICEAHTCTAPPLE